MYRESFPKCKIKGDMTPAPFGHGFMSGSVPKKCTTCSHLFEGGCLRDTELNGGYLRLDYSPCPVSGDTHPIAIDTNDKDQTFIPTKCRDCSYLNSEEFTCKFEKEIWGDFERDLDWGNWQPDYPLVGLRRVELEGSSMVDKGQAKINKALIQLLQRGKTAKAIKLYHELNSIEFLRDAKNEVEEIARRLRKREST